MLWFRRKLSMPQCCLVLMSMAAVDEDLIRHTADLLVTSGLEKAGYHYLVIDGVLPCTVLLLVGVNMRSC